MFDLRQVIWMLFHILHEHIFITLWYLSLKLTVSWILLKNCYSYKSPMKYLFCKTEAASTTHFLTENYRVTVQWRQASLIGLIAVCARLDSFNTSEGLRKDIQQTLVY